ncbi:MAG: hypothetical protein FWG32_00325 [Oscillospiraceae bacterium]|nr:hypothetical protein [Oscillospiraceae bacterium]
MIKRNRTRRFGDRKEGRKLRSISAFYRFTPFIMKTRNDACNYFKDSIEVTETDKWLRQKRAEGYKGMGMLHLFIATYVRTIALLPALNRFVSGQRIYSRDTIEIVLAVKRALTAEATETTIKVNFDPEDTVFDVYRKLNASVDEIKAGEAENSTEKVAGALCRLPALFLKFTIWLLNIMDYFDLLPIPLIDASPFHGSMIITDMGSLGLPPIYHHLYNFGNLPVFIAFGAKRKSVEPDDQFRAEERKYIDFTAVTDERTVDGYYYAAAFKHVKYFIRNPRFLEKPPEKVEEDVF